MQLSKRCKYKLIENEITKKVQTKKKSSCDCDLKFSKSIEVSLKLS